MTSLDHAALDEAERNTLDRLVAELREGFGHRLVAVWLYGSRARGERHDESDVDVMVVLTEEREGDRDLGHRLANAATVAEASWSTLLSVRVRDEAWLAGRRQIESFFIAEVDRDRVSLYERP